MKSLKIVLAVSLFLCLFHLPYGFYMLVRFGAMVCFAVFAYDYYTQSKTALCVTAAAFALLFQPFMKISLGREVWNVVDVIVAVLLIVSVTLERGGKKLP